jgi:hypothetical protein
MISVRIEKEKEKEINEEGKRDKTNRRIYTYPSTQVDTLYLLQVLQNNALVLVPAVGAPERRHTDSRIFKVRSCACVTWS